MNKLFAIIVLGSATCLSADQYYQGYYSDQGSYQTPNYYQQDQSQYYYNTQPNNMQTYAYDNSQKNSTADQEINKKIKEIISSGSGWFAKRFADVSFDVNNGVVNLKGTVDSDANRMMLEESVKKIAGVTRVNNQITIARDATDVYTNTPENHYISYGNQASTTDMQYADDTATTSQDKQLNDKIRERLKGISFARVNDTLVIRTNNGVVIISGSVNNDEEAKKIVDQIRAVVGVKTVSNQLMVKK